MPDLTDYGVGDVKARVVLLDLDDIATRVAALADTGTTFELELRAIPADGEPVSLYRTAAGETS